KDHSEAVAAHLGVDSLLHRLDPGQRVAGERLGHGIVDIPRNRIWIDCSAHGKSRPRPRILPEWNKHLRCGLIVQMFAVANALKYTDNLPFSRRPCRLRIR